MLDGRTGPVPAAVVGRFSWNVDTDTWQWSEGSYVLHGYACGAVQPSRQLVLAHKHAADRAATEALLQRLATGPQSFSHYHRIVNVGGRQRTVLSVGATAFNAHGQLVSSGYLADVTDSERHANTAAIEAAMQYRQAINQAQGAVMAVYGLTPEAALNVLIWHSRTYNIKLNLLARRIIAALGARDDSEQILRPQMDALLFAEATTSAVTA